MDHQLKTNPEFFERVWGGTKTYEVRVDDRGFAEGDTVVLLEHDPLAVCLCVTHKPLDREACAKYSGRWVEARVGYVFTVDPTIPRRVVFGLLDRVHSDDAAAAQRPWRDSVAQA